MSAHVSAGGDCVLKKQGRMQDSKHQQTARCHDEERDGGLGMGLYPGDELT